jgi:hypothetical protein|tara:strand:- start:674 stop:1294 length:621 start_codon:yes stop_codon:yes gene_type:complete
MANLTKFGVPTGGTTTPVLMPKLQYRFRVEFRSIGGSADSKSLTHQIVSVTRPTLTHEEVTLDVYNSRVYLAGKHTWEPITIVIRDDVDNNVIKLIDSQMQNQIDHHEQSAPLAGAQYKFTTIIDTLDGKNDSNTGPDILDTWTLGGCFISSAAYNESNYATSDAQIINLTIRYDNAKHEDDVGLNLLNGQSVDGTLLGATSNSNG